MSDWAAAASAANAAYLLSQDLLLYHRTHIHHLTVTAATTPVHTHNDSYLAHQVHANTVLSDGSKRAVTRESLSPDSFVVFCVKSSLWVVPALLGSYFLVVQLFGASQPQARATGQRRY